MKPRMHFSPFVNFAASTGLVFILCAGCGSGVSSAEKDGAKTAPTASPGATELTRQVFAEILKVSDPAAKNELLGLAGVLQATFGNPDGAWSVIDKLEQSPIREQALGQFVTFQLWIANIRGAEGDYAGGRKAYEFARRAVQNLKPQGHGGDAMIVSLVKETSPEQWEAKARLAGGSTAGSVEAALKIKDPRGRQRALVEILKAQAKAGKSSEAKETLKHIESRGDRWQCLEAIAIGQSRARDIDGAKNSIQQIEAIMAAAEAEDPKREFYVSRASALALAAFASAQSKAGDAAGAKQSLAAAHQAAGEVQAYQVSSLMRDIAQMQLEMQDQAGARQSFVFWENLLQTREQELRQAYGMWNESHKALSMALARAGQLEDSKRVLSKIENQSDQPAGAEAAANPTNKRGVDEDAIAAIIQTQLSRGDIKGALVSLEPIADTARGKGLRDKIVTELLKSNDHDAVLTVAEKISDVDTRFWLLIRGDVASRVPGALTTAAKIAREIPDTPGMKKGQARDNALRWVVEAQVRAGELDQARETLKEIVDDEELAIAKAAIARAEGGGKDSRSAVAGGKAPSSKHSDLLAQFETMQSLADWQSNEKLQQQLSNAVSTEVKSGNIAGAQQLLRKLVQLAAQRFRMWAVTLK